MNGVALRCPSCGTTQSHSGECDACSEDQVRYFCSNHDPGLWLDRPACASCGARFGDPPKRSPESPARRPGAAASAPVTGRTRSAAKTRTDPEFPPTGHTRPGPRRADAEDSPVTPSLADLLGELAEDRARPRYRIEEPPTVAPPPAVAAAIPVVGCFLRLLLLLVVVIALVVVGLFMLFNGGMG